MHILDTKSRLAFFCCALLFTLLAADLKADNIAYMGTISNQFGTIDLNTGVFSLLGNSGVTLAGLAVANATIYGSSYHTATGTLYTINPANGSLTVVGTANLYSINSTNGAATLIGPAGLGFGTWRSLSTNASTLYFADGANLYTLNTATGAATLLGNMGGPQIGAMLLEGGILYGGEDSPGLRVDTLNITTGAATTGPNVAGISSAFCARTHPVAIVSAGTRNDGFVCTWHHSFIADSAPRGPLSAALLCRTAEAP